MSDLARITKAILADYVLPVHGIHGVVHWARVLENGLSVARKTGADCEVVTLFALFHDSRRVSDGHDHGHGLRGGELARSLRGDLIHLDDRAFELLYEACRLHTDGLNDGDPTLLACWDADRLDLGRVGITPHPGRLCTDAARGLLTWAHRRSVNGWLPAGVLSAMGVGTPDRPADALPGVVRRHVVASPGRGLHPREPDLRKEGGR